MPLSRRTLLAALPGRSLWSALSFGPSDVLARPGLDPAAPAPVPARPDPSVLQRNTVAVLAGTKASNARPEAAPRLAAIDAAARAGLAAMDRAGRGELFADLPLGTDDTYLAESYRLLHDIALATRIPGPTASDLPGNTAVQQRVAEALLRLYDDHYGDQRRGYYGNWFIWEIGISSSLSRILVLLADQLTSLRPDMIPAHIAAMDGYLRHGKDGDVDLDSRFHTGANLADITTNRMTQGAVLGDDARIVKAVADLSTVLDTVDPYAPRHGVTDGFHADGSFLQHTSVAYTGTYGRDLLSRVVGALGLLDGSGYADTVALAEVVLDRLTHSYAPVIFEGWTVECVKGRAVSRPTTGYADAAGVLEAATALSAYLPGPGAAALAGWVKYVAATSAAPLAPAALVSPLTAVRYADLLADPSVPPKDISSAASHHAFHAMDRTVHRRPGYAFALARTSTRVSAYEYMSGENLMPWFQGQGAHHLYLSGQDQARAFGADHTATVSPYRLAGVVAPVETRATVPELYGTPWYDNPDRGFTSSSEAQNTYVYAPRSTHPHSGGATTAGYGAVGLVHSDDAARAAAAAGLLPADFVAYRGAAATRSWFLFDDEIVVLAAGVGGRAGRAATTTVDTRVSDPTATVRVTGRLRTGGRFAATGTAPLAWLRYAEGTASVGYVFLDPPGAGPRPVVTSESVTGDLRAVRTANPDTPVTKRVFSVSFEHPAGAPPERTAYALVPNASERQLAAYAHGPLAVLGNTTRMQAVTHAGLGLTAVNTFTPGHHRLPELTVEGPASVILRHAPDGTRTVAVADPTTERPHVRVTVHGSPAVPVSADAGVTVRRVAGGVRIEVDTHHAYGRTVTVVLR